jgi:glycosyltransferase involved in cell wall biosynthesis
MKTVSKKPEQIPDIATDRPLVSFLLVTYNQEEYIRDAVEGAFAQTYEPLEIILSDDCSSDRTFDILRELAEGYSGPHSVYVRQNTKNSGTLQHLQFAVEESKGSLLVVAAGDDVSRTSRVEELYDSWKSQGSWAVFSDFADIDYKGKVINEHSEFEPIGEPRCDLIFYMKGCIIEHNIVHGATSAYDRRIFDNLILPEDNYILGEDGALSLLLYILKKEVSYINKPLVEYRKHDDSLTNSTRQRLSWPKLAKAENKMAMYARSNSNRCAFILESHGRLNQSKETRIDLQLVQKDMKNQRIVANWWNMNLLQKLMRLPGLDQPLFIWAFPRLLPMQVFLAVKYMAGFIGKKSTRR